jgi:hypothetical protein
MRRAWLPVVLAALSVPVASASASNDSSSTPTALQDGVAQIDDTSAYTVEAGEQNTTAPFTQACGTGGSPFGVAATAWFTIQGTGQTVMISTEGSNFDTAIFAYSGAPSGPLVTCNDNAATVARTSSVSFASGAGTKYLLQIGHRCDSFAIPYCSVSGGQLKVLAIAPAAVPAPIPVPVPPSGGGTPPALHVNGSLIASYARRYTRVRKLTISGAPLGALVAVSCTSKGRACPFRRKTLVNTSLQPLSLTKYVRRAKLHRGDRITVRVTKPGHIGTALRYTIRLHHAPIKRVFCLEPGQDTPHTIC